VDDLTPATLRVAGVPLFDTFSNQPALRLLTGELSPETERLRLSDSNRKFGVALKRTRYPTTRLIPYLPESLP